MYVWRALACGAGAPIGEKQPHTQPTIDANENRPDKLMDIECSLLHLQVVELAGLRARNEPWPVHRHALQWRRCIEGPTFLETKRRAVALRDLTGARVVERAAIALALLDELEAICEPRARGFAPMYEPRARGFAPMYEYMSCGVEECW